MKHEVKLAESQKGFEDKVYVIADEVLSILKELSQENRDQINSAIIAEKMFWRDSLKGLLQNEGSTASKDSADAPSERNFAHALLDKLTEIMPESITEKLCDLKDLMHHEGARRLSGDLLDSPFRVIRKFIDTLTGRNQELEDFMHQTVKYLSETEMHVVNELSSQQQKFRDDKHFQDNISEHMAAIVHNVNTSNDLKAVKVAVKCKIDNINKGIELKREQDMQRLNETQKNLEEMNRRMIEIKNESEEIRRRAQEIEFEAMHDGLTGLYNRKAFDLKMTETLAHQKRYDAPASLIVCDVDFFKKINDSYGHNVGDLALKKLAALLKERMRINDFIARYGGEEFVVILPHTELGGAIIAGEGIRSCIDSSIFSYRDREIHLTVSIGISSFSKIDSEDTVFERADRALYLAKKSGRNLVRTENDISDNVVEPGS